MEGNKLEMRGIFEMELTAEEFIAKLNKWLTENNISFEGETRELNLDEFELPNEVLITVDEIEEGRARGLDVKCKVCGTEKSNKWFGKRDIKGFEGDIYLACEKCVESK